ncbi:PIN domain-containing protein [Lentibacter algarum]|uniref:RSP_2648 family PIN domain-containing protein n=1 Tax=Lentibacter algarum TaxID=576131 RepID=UPI001C077DDF|nr:PIN domain-containing protein [Lentibacter algarum]MBU2980832.1 PIN domain-containing protein [Lentibacter algarum]
MKALLDTCVLYPTVMREMLLGVADAGAFLPFWSKGIEGEWAHTAEKHGAGGGLFVHGELALLNARWPKARVQFGAALEQRLWLPDAGDIHVLAAAVASSADVIITLNKKDFPANVLSEEGLSRADPDTFLRGIWAADPVLVEPVALKVLAKARSFEGSDWTMRGLLKKARLPRLGKALETLG